jgi:hypothetical protein
MESIMHRSDLTTSARAYFGKENIRRGVQAFFDRFPDGKFENLKVVVADDSRYFRVGLCSNRRRWSEGAHGPLRSLAVRWRQGCNEERISQGAGITEVHSAAHFAMRACHQTKSGASDDFKDDKADKRCQRVRT